MHVASSICTLRTPPSAGPIETALGSMTMKYLVCPGWSGGKALASTRIDVAVKKSLHAALLREVIHRFLTRKANVALAVQRRSLRKRIQFPPRLRVEKRLRFHAPGIHWIHGDLRIRHGARNGGHFAAVIAHSAESRD